MSGVKNLRAMFEQKGETSPPDRGRSPGIPWTPSPSSDSPRPLSKVRTNFIAIEKDGRIGLQRETSQDSVLSVTRKFSGGSDAAPTPPAVQQDSDVFAGNMEKGSPSKTNLKYQPIPESPRVDTAEPKTAPQKTATEPKLQPPSDATARSKKPGPDNATDATKPTRNGSGSLGELPVKHLNGTDRAKEKDKLPNKEVEKVQAKSTTKSSPKPLAASSAAKTVAKPARSPMAAKAPKSPADMPATKLPSKAPEKVAQHGDKGAAPKANFATSKTAASSSIRRPPPLQASTSSGTGFVKPKPKSPTRPVKLPASLTTHTAASGSKLANGPRQSLSRASGELQGRSPSRDSVSTAGASSTRLSVAQSLKRQSSTTNRPRPSLGPPPKQPSRDHPPTKKDKEVDEGFLARMTRPTQAFQSKITGKVPTSPPRKSSAATPAANKPVTVNSHAPKFASKIGGPPPRSRSKAPARSSSSPSHQPERSTANQVAIRVEHADTAEEVIETAKAIEGTVTPPPTLPEEEPGQKTPTETTTTQEIAPIAEQIETAEEATEMARDIEGDVTLSEGDDSATQSSDHHQTDNTSKDSTPDFRHFIKSDEMDIEVVLQQHYKALAAEKAQAEELRKNVEQLDVSGASHDEEPIDVVSANDAKTEKIDTQNEEKEN